MDETIPGEGRPLILVPGQTYSLHQFRINLHAVTTPGGVPGVDIIPFPEPRTPLTAKPSGERRCVCVTQHRPEPVILHSHHVWPLGEGGPDIQANLLWVCPSTHSNIHELWRLLVKAGKTGVPLPWREHRQFSEYVRGVVARGYAQAKEAGQVA